MGEENNQLYYYHGDHLGSAQIVTDPEGKIYEQLEYTPYGELWVEHLKTTIETTPFRFTGKERDSETGLYYYGARYLNPQTSMWLSADPAMGEYIPQAPINDEAQQHNKELPGDGRGV
jgi:RHS repeat-associated protein